MKSLSRSLAFSFLSLLGVAVLGGSAAAQSPLWANDLVPNQFPARNAVPGKDDPPLATDNGHDNSWQDKLRHLAQISDDQTSQDTGDPVSPVVGIVSHRVVDLFIPGRGLDFSFERRYNSKSSGTDGPLGYGWDHCYHARVQVVSGTGGAQVIVNNGNDRQDLYTWTAQDSNIYDSPPGVYTLLRYYPASGNTPPRYVLRNREGVRSYFDNNVLTKIQDPNGNAITFTYNATNDHIDYVIDTMGRRIDFTYDGNGRLILIQDFRGRQVVYTYDSNGNLTEVRTPTVTSTAGFNDFTSGRTEHYTYLSGNNNLLDHKLASIIRPNDAGQSTPSVRFYYDTSSNSVFFGWCTSQFLGGTNAAGSAGGTIGYSYEVLDWQTSLTATNHLLVERLRGTVTDRNGNVTDYYVNQNGNVTRVVTHDGSTSYTTTNEYNEDGELVKITQPRGNYTTIAYQNSIRNLDGNIASLQYFNGGITSDQSERDESFEYEPIFNNLSAYTDSNNHVTLNYTDYQEGTTSSPNDVIPALQTELLDIYSRSQVLDLFSGLLNFFQNEDLNGDGQQAIAKGNIVKIVHPEATISSLGGAPLAALEGDVYQQAFLTKTYNAYGQVTSQTDEEENITVNLYYPESDPDGDGVPTSPGTGLNTVTGGYLKREVVDTSLPYSDSQLTGVAVRNQSDDIGRDSAKNPTPVNKVTDYKYDPSGNFIAVVDPRGVKYEYSVNELDEVWQEKRATDVSAAATRAGGINGATEDLTGQAFAYDTLRKFDANGNVIAEFVQNAGAEPDGVAVTGAPGNHWEAYWTYDILDNWPFAGFLTSRGA